MAYQAVNIPRFWVDNFQWRKALGLEPFIRRWDDDNTYPEDNWIGMNPSSQIKVGSVGATLDYNLLQYNTDTITYQNTDGINNQELYNENIKIIMIDYDIKTLLRKLKEFKIKYNEEYLSKSVLDVGKVKEGQELINNIKRDIRLLEQNYNTINKIRLT